MASTATIDQEFQQVVTMALKTLVIVVVVVFVVVVFVIFVV